MTEAIYMENKENQVLKIRKIFNWYFDNLKRDKDLKKISERTEKEWYQEEEVEAPKEEPENIQRDDQDLLLSVFRTETAKTEGRNQFVVRQVQADAYRG